MKKKKAIIVSLLIVALLVWLVSVAFGDGGNGTAPVHAVTLSDLGVSDTGLLPSNPFYFSEEWMRNVQRIFATDPLDKSKLELHILNSKAAELLTSSELNPVDPSAIKDAVTNYGNELQTMGVDLQLLSDKNADTDALLNSLASKLFMHYQILEEIKTENGDSNGGISSIQSQIDAILNEIPSYMSDSSQFGAMLSGSINSQPDDLGLGLRSLSFIDGLEEANSSVSVRAQLDQLKQDQVLRFEGRYDADGMSYGAIPGILGQLPVSDLNKAKLVGDLRDFVVDGGLASQLNGLRGSILANASSSGEISYNNASDMINYAGILIDQAWSGQQPDNKSLLEASSLISEANTDIGNGAYSSAFGEASDAASVADNFLFSSEHGTANSSDNISRLTDRLSSLEGKAAGQGLVNSDDPRLFALFGSMSSMLSNKPSISDIYRFEESVDEADFALNNAQNGIASALIPVPGKGSLQGSVVDEQSISTTTQAGVAQYCPEIYEPVCGSDSVTYTNKCFEGLAGADQAYKGECRATSTSTAALPTSTDTTTVIK